MTNSSEKIKQKIQKLLNIAGDSSYASEVEAALLKAQELMAKHDISSEDVKASDRGEVVTEFINIGGRVVSWKSALLKVLADNFRCHSYIHPSQEDGKRIVELALIGRVRDIEITTNAFHKTVLAVTGFSLEYRKTVEGYWRQLKSSYFMGFVHGLKARFEEQKEANPEWGLVLVKDPEVDRSYENLALAPGRSSKARLYDETYTAGYQKGNKYSLKDQTSINKAYPKMVGW